MTGAGRAVIETITKRFPNQLGNQCYEEKRSGIKLTRIDNIKKSPNITKQGLRHKIKRSSFIKNEGRITLSLFIIRRKAFAALDQSQWPFYQRHLIANPHLRPRPN